MIKVAVFPNGDVYELDQIPEYMSDDYIIRETEICDTCGCMLEPHYNEPFASCACYTSEWYK